jgi:hypothetical protein
MTPPNVYPEGIPFYDARPPQDGPDRFIDDSYLVPQGGGTGVTTGSLPVLSGGQTVVPGLSSPQDFLPEPVQSPITTEDAITLITGPIPAPESDGEKPDFTPPT